MSMSAPDPSSRNAPGSGRNAISKRRNPGIKLFGSPPWPPTVRSGVTIDRNPPGCPAVEVKSDGPPIDPAEKIVTAAPLSVAPAA